MVQQQISGTSSYSLFNMYEVLQTVFQYCGNLPAVKRPPCWPCKPGATASYYCTVLYCDVQGTWWCGYDQLMFPSSDTILHHT